MDDPSRLNPRGYPLSALFLLVAACGVVTALVTPVMHAVASGNLGLVETLGSSFGGCLIILVLGGILGLYHYRPIRGFLWGSIAGGMIGALVGPIVLAPPEAFAALLITSIGGALVLLVIGAALPLFNAPQLNGGQVASLPAWDRTQRSVLAPDILQSKIADLIEGQTGRDSQRRLAGETK